MNIKRVSPLSTRSAFIDQWGRTLFYTLCSLLARLIFRIFCRVHLLILESPPAEGALIVAANQISHFDPALLGAFFPRQIDWVGMEELFKYRWGAHFLSWLGVIPVDRSGKNGGRNRQALKTMLSRLAAGRVLGIFPEGGIRSGSASILEGAPIKPGITTLSLKSQAAIVPCIVLGTDRLYAQKIGRQRPHLWIIIGRVIRPPAPSVADPKERLQQQLAAAFPSLQKELCKRFELSNDDLPKTAQERRTPQS